MLCYSMLQFILFKVLYNRIKQTDWMLSFRCLLLFCIVIPYYKSMSGFCSCASVLLSISVFGFSVAVCLFLCLEASHTIYSLAPFLLPDRPIVSHWCTVGDIHTRGMLFLIHNEQADTRHVENSIHSFFFQRKNQICQIKKYKSVQGFEGQRQSAPYLSGWCWQ